MDALTSFEMEALRRRETVASDRDNAWARANASTGSVDVEVTPLAAIPATRSQRGPVAQGDCQPAPLARQSAG